MVVLKQIVTTSRSFFYLYHTDPGQKTKLAPVRRGSIFIVEKINNSTAGSQNVVFPYRIQVIFK